MIPLVIAGTASGVGKTTVAIGLMGALTRRGLEVAPFKTGPDYIDPGYHMAVTGNPSRNLDTWLTSPEAVRDIFRRGSAGAGVALIEGAMGLFDGRTGGGGACSTAEVARLTAAAVVLVVDCARLARSLAPLLEGFVNFDPEVNIAGAILNNVGSPGHARALEAAAREAGVPVFGVLPRREDIRLESRHLGLVQAGGQMEMLGRIVEHVAANTDSGRLLALAVSSGCGGGTDGASQGHEGTATEARGRRPARIAVARDEAFSFYYLDSLEALEDAGGELVYFSPIHDPELPSCDGVHFGGGYPELFAAALEKNSSMRASIAGAAAAGMPVYAECGGLVYLCQDVTVEGEAHGMAGALPLHAEMSARRQALGYVEASARRNNILIAAGETIRGHEFHWSAVDWRPESVAYDCRSGREEGMRPDGFSNGNLLASYVHTHFAGNPGAAARFVAACAGREVA